VWLVLMAAPLAAAGLPWREPRRARVVPLVLAACAVLVVAGIARGPLNTAATPRLVDRALLDAHGTPILADTMRAEQIALAGGTVWIANPVDAFSRADQRVWLAWLEGKPSGDVALAHAPRVVLVARASPAARRIAGNTRYRLDAQDANTDVFVRRR
jgi:hypothetical protein